MNVENAVYPTSDQLAELARAGAGKPIVMLNLLRFRAMAEYADARATRLTGRQAYMLYAEAMQQIVVREGGRILFSGEVHGLAIGTVGEMWDAVALVEYPSAEAFVRIATSPDVAAIGIHRAAGLEGQLLIRVDRTDGIAATGALRA